MYRCVGVIAICAHRTSYSRSVVSIAIVVKTSTRINSITIFIYTITINFCCSGMYGCVGVVAVLSCWTFCSCSIITVSVIVRAIACINSIAVLINPITINFCCSGMYGCVGVVAVLSCWTFCSCSIITVSIIVNAIACIISITIFIYVVTINFCCSGMYGCVGVVAVLSCWTFCCCSIITVSVIVIAIAGVRSVTILIYAIAVNFYCSGMYGCVGIITI